MDIATPIVVVEGGDVIFFASKEAAERYVEPIDVLNNEYKIYDSEGRLLKADVERQSGDLFASRFATGEVVKIKNRDDGYRDEEDLRRAVQHLLATSGFTEAQYRGMSLKHLIEQAVRIFGYTT